MKSITSALKHADKLARYDSVMLLDAIRKINKIDIAEPGKDVEILDERLRLIKDINGAAEEIDMLKDFGLTVQFKKLVPMGIPDAFWERMFGGVRGEIYVVGFVLDGSGQQTEFKSRVFRGCREKQPLPLGDGGMLVAFIRNPKWFIDVHMLVMESDSDIQLIGKAIEEAKKEAKVDEIFKLLSAMAIFDPTVISKALIITKKFIDILVYILKNNGDDYIGTIHDFYLKHQAFGRGTHSMEATGKNEGVEAEYQIELTQL